MKVTNALSLPEPFVNAVKSDYRYTPNRYSVTSLGKGYMQLLLERAHENELTAEVADSVWLIFGAAVHKVLEESQETNSQIKEGHLEYTFEDIGMTVSGIFDLYDDSTGIVTDYKTASTWKVIYDEWDDYRQQLLRYVWLLRANGFSNAKTGQIVALLKDHSKSKAKREMNYPSHPVYIKEWDFSDEEIEQAGKDIKNRLSLLKQYQEWTIEDVPPCTDEERWFDGDKYAVVEKGKKRAKRVLDSFDDAENYIKEKNLSNAHIEKRAGVDKKCWDYCDVCEWCPHFTNIVCNKINEEEKNV